jgi:uncharacterized protein DUF3105
VSKSSRVRNQRQSKNALTERTIPWGSVAFFGVIGLVVLIAIGWAAWTAFKPAEKISGLIEKNDLKQDHVQTPVKYEDNPPMGGPHNAVWQACDGRVYDQPLKNEHAVHSLEHGAVWITYKPGLPGDQLDKLKDRVDGKDYMMMSPIADQPTSVVLTAWGKQLRLKSFDQGQVDAFIKEYLRGPQTPEPGAACASQKVTP